MKKLFQATYYFGFIICLFLMAGRVNAGSNIPMWLIKPTLITGFLAIGKIIYTKEK